jgi:hypothetical protein
MMPSMRLSTLRAVVARCRAPDQNAAVAGAVYRVGRDPQAARIDRENGGVAAADGVAAHVALDRLECDAVAAGIDDFAIGDADRAALSNMQKPAPLRQRDSGAVEDQTTDADVIGAGGR